MYMRKRLVCPKCGIKSAIIIILLFLIIASFDGVTFAAQVDFKAGTFLGGTGNEFIFGHGVALDSQGNVFVVGRTVSADFPVTPGAYLCTSCGGYDIYISKFDPDLTTLLASTKIGGVGDEEYPDICIDSDDNIFVTGATLSSNFPTTEGAYNRNQTGGSDFFLAKFSPDLSQVLAATYIGGHGYETFPTIKIGSENNIFIGGVTSYSDYPTTIGAFDRIYNGGNSDYVVSKFSNSLTHLTASTFVGGVYWEEFPSIGLDADDNVFVGGCTTSHDFPTTPGSYDPTFNGPHEEIEYNRDVAIAKLSGDLTTLITGTFIGRGTAFYLTGAPNGDVVITGHTGSINYPTTPGAFVEIHNGENESFITRLSSNLDVLKASTFLSGLPGGNHGLGNSMVIGNDNNIYFTGYTFSSQMHTTADAYDTTFNGVVDVTLMKFDSTLSTLVYSTYLGGAAGENGDDIAVGENGVVYITGKASSANFPTQVTYPVYDMDYNGGDDAFVVRFAPESEFVCGDVNDDDAINVGDAVFLINFIFHNGPMPYSESSGDVNCDGSINVGDAVYLINYIFDSGAQEPCAGCVK